MKLYTRVLTAMALCLGFISASIAAPQNSQQSGNRAGMFCVESSSMGGVGMQNVCPNINTHWPDVFGPPTWWVLHVMAEHYPETPAKTTKRACENFVSGIAFMLPCRHCGDHFSNIIKDWTAQNGSMCNSRNDIKTFMCDAHNMVNAGTGKDIQSCDSQLLYEQYGQSPKCPSH